MFVVLEKTSRSALPLVRRLNSNSEQSESSLVNQIFRRAGSPARRIDYMVDQAHVSIHIQPLGQAQKVLIVWPEDRAIAQSEMIELAEQTWCAFSKKAA